MLDLPGDGFGGVTEEGREREEGWLRFDRMLIVDNGEAARNESEMSLGCRIRFFCVLNFCKGFEV